MAEEIQSTNDNVFIWLDEKRFIVEAIVNSQNDRILA